MSKTYLYVVVIFSLFSNLSFCIVVDQTDNFQNSTTQDWATGTVNPNQTTLMTTGGYRGAGDFYIRQISIGGFGAGKALVIFNDVQWAGDYINANVHFISMRVNNTGSNNLTLHLGFSNSLNTASTTSPVTVNAGSGWQTISFSCDSTNITELDGGTYNSVFGNITELRILHSTVPAYTGSAIAGQLDIDDITAAESPLPVELTSFTVTADNNNIKLKWSTATELNNFGFKIERMDKNSTWKNISFVIGSGNSNSPKEYSFTDKDVSENNSYTYKLIQIDINGTTTYSKEVEINADFTPIEYFLSQNYPNPFNPSTVIKYSIPKISFVSLKVYNAIGKEVADLVNETQVANEHTVNFDASKNNSGIYYYTLKAGNNFSQTKKMILVK